MMSRISVQLKLDSVFQVIRLGGLRFSAIGLSMLFSVVAARQLGVGEFGNYVSIMAIVGLLSIATQFGLPSLIEREIATSRGNGDVARLGLLMRIAIAPLALSVAAVLLSAFLGKTVILAAAFNLTAFLVALAGSLLIGYERVELVAAINSVVRPGLAILFLISFGFSVSLDTNIAIVAQICAALVSAAALIINFRYIDLRLVRRAALDASQRQAQLCEYSNLAKAGLHFALVQTAINATQQADLLWLSLYSNSSEAAYFFAIARAAFAVQILHAAVLALSAPKIFRMTAERNMLDRDEEVLSSSRTSFALVMLASILAAAVGPYYLKLFGNSFAEFSTLLWLMLAGGLPVAAMGPIAQVLIAHRQESKVWNFFFAGIFSGAICAAIVIPILGATGGVISYLTMNATIYVLVGIRARNLLGYLPVCGFKLAVVHKETDV